MISLIGMGAIASPASKEAEAASEHAELPTLVSHLRDDSALWNAHYSMQALQRHGREAVATLETALGSDDWQQRQLAAQALIAIPGYEPSLRQLEVCIEGLRNDHLPWGERSGGRNLMVFNASDGARWLCNHAALAKPFLVRGLDSGDEQQRFLSAFVCAWTRDETLVRPVAAVLIPHLRDNRIPNDALFAAAALYRLGRCTLPYLADALHGADSQQRRLLRELTRDILDPPRDDEMALRAAPRAVRLHPGYWLPHVQFQLTDIEIHWGEFKR